MPLLIWLNLAKQNMVSGGFMIVEFKDSNCLSGVKDVFIRDGKKLLKIFLGANGDLYFNVFGSRNQDENGLYISTFCIKENEEIYQYFEQLFSSIMDCKVFNTSKNEFEFCNSDKGIDEIGSVQKINVHLKMEESYKTLVHDNTIVWYSDNIYDESANILRIERDDEEIKLTFIDNPEDPSFGFGIRICNSGSKYDPFNICFMNLFNQLQLLAKETLAKTLVKS